MTILEVDTREGADAVHVLLRGELDLSTVEKVEEALRRVEADSPGVLVLDLTALKFLDSTGLRTIVTADQRAREGGRRLVIVKGSANVQRVFAITRLDDRLEMIDDTAELASG